MSRQIDITQPLSDEDRVYLEERCDNYALAQNAAFLKGEEFSSSDLAVDPLEAYSLENATTQPPAPVEEAPAEEPVEEQASKKK
jgi:hypothetical protein